MADALPRGLVEAYAKGALVPFVGAGVSMAVRTRAGEQAFPSWWGLLDRAAKRLADEGREAEHQIVRGMLALPDLLAAADYAKRGLGAVWPEFLTEALGCELDQLDPSSLALARAVWQLGSSLVITTNYDKVLRWACPRAADLDALTNESQAELARLQREPPRRPTVWHLHGSLTDVANLILAPDGYRLLYPSEGHESRHRAALTTLRALMVSKCFVFVGFSLDDEAFVRQLEWVAETFAGFAGRHYVLVRERERDAVAAKLAGLDVQPIAFAEFGAPLVELLGRIAGSSRPAPAPTPAPEPKPSAPVAGPPLAGDSWASGGTMIASSAFPPNAPAVAGPMLAPGSHLLGRYRLIAPRGRGGFAVVWQALDLHENRLVAIKASRADDPGRFLAGATAMRGLQHEAIAAILAGPYHEAGLHFFVMPWYRDDLRSALLERGLAREVALAACVHALAGLAHAHAQGLVHRDVKPDNLLLDDRSQGLLSDFDLVHAGPASTGSRVAGSYAYAAPELGMRGQVVDARTDVYGAAMTVLFVLLGEDPPPLVLLSEPERIAEATSDERLQAALRGALAYRASERTTTLAQLMAAIRGIRVAAPTIVIPKRAVAWADESGEDQFGTWATLRIGEVVQRMRWIVPGEFVMGSPENEEGRFDHEGPQHTVRFTTGFWLADTPCTQAMWAAVMDSRPSKFAGPNRPVEQVSWTDAQEFMAALHRRIPALDAGLPTEARWEYACRAGSPLARYGQLDAIALHAGNGGNTTHDVGHKQANAWGLFDMLGNVWEWCADAGGPYSAAASVDPVPSEHGQGRVARGGSWGVHARFVRAAYRGWDEPGRRDEGLGLRLAGGQGLRQASKPRK